MFSACELTANRSDQWRGWIVPTALLLLLVFDGPVMAEAFRPQLEPMLRQLDRSTNATLTFQSRGDTRDSGAGLLNTSCVYEISGDSFEFGKLVSMLISDSFALGSQNSFGALPPDNFEPNISVIFAKSGHEFLAFYFDDRADQIGVKGRLTVPFLGSGGHYRMREIATFPKDLRELARRSKVTERDECGS